jgi:pyridoxamine 5'-phosphate oxidase
MKKEFESGIQEYKLGKLRKKDVNPNPIVQFEKWLDEAISKKEKDPTAMALATATPDGKLSCRIVLLRELNDKGFIFYSSYKSWKGKQIMLNHYGALNFYWARLERQVRIEGYIEKVNSNISDKYFNSRSRGKKLGVWTMLQSRKIPNRKYLENLFEEQKNNFDGKEIPRPADWGGYILKPCRIEFWQGRENRLHDRIMYEKKNMRGQMNRLAP